MDRASFVIEHPADRIAIRRAIETAPLGTRFELKGPQRTLDQNAKIRAMLGELAKQGVWLGEPRSPVFWKDLFSASVFIASGLEVVPGLEGGLLIFGRSTADMSVAEAMDMITYMTLWGEANGVHFQDSTGATVVAA
jgi:hypothetical protein